jgi:hypothetical protein
MSVAPSSRHNRIMIYGPKPENPLDWKGEQRQNSLLPFCYPTR